LDSGALFLKVKQPVRAADQTPSAEVKIVRIYLGKHTGVVYELVVQHYEDTI
jgi:hypothetical protein